MLCLQYLSLSGARTKEVVCPTVPSRLISCPRLEDEAFPTSKDATFVIKSHTIKLLATELFF